MKKKMIKNYFENYHSKHFVKIASFAISFAFFTFPVHAQNYNYYYSHGNGMGILSPAGKSIVASDGQCGMATADTYMLDNANAEFHLTLLSANGSFIKAFKIGTEQNEYCHGICKSMDFSDQYLLCGRSKNNRMLVMKVNTLGTVIWSKEVQFSFEDSDGITVFPVNPNPVEKGYIVVGNSNSTQGINSVAAVKLNENGMIMWSAEYNMGVKIQVTDAIPRNLHLDQIASVVGYRANAGIFLLNIKTSSGAIYPGTGALYDLQAGNPLVGAHLSEISSQGDKNLVISYMRNPIFSPSTTDYAFRIEGTSLFSPIWSKHYSRSGNFTYYNNDLITLSTNKLTMLGGLVNTANQAHPFTLNLDFAGNLSGYRDYSINDNSGGCSIIETCNTGYETFNGVVAAPADGAVKLRVIKRNLAPPVDCSEQILWQAANEPLVKTNLTMTHLTVGTAYNYPVTVIELEGVKYNCTNDQVQKITGLSEQNEKNSAPWFYPNPAHSKIELQLEENPVLVKLLDITGKVVFSQVLKGTTSVDLSNFSTGVYFIEKTNSHGLTEKQKLIIE